MYNNQGAGCTSDRSEEQQAEGGGEGEEEEEAVRINTGINTSTGTDRSINANTDDEIACSNDDDVENLHRVSGSMDTLAGTTATSSATTTTTASSSPSTSSRSSPSSICRAHTTSRRACWAAEITKRSKIIKSQAEVQAKVQVPVKVRTASTSTGTSTSTKTDEEEQSHNDAARVGAFNVFHSLEDNSLHVRRSRRVAGEVLVMEGGGAVGVGIQLEGDNVSTGTDSRGNQSQGPTSDSGSHGMAIANPVKEELQHQNLPVAVEHIRGIREVDSQSKRIRQILGLLLLLLLIAGIAIAVALALYERHTEATGSGRSIPLGDFSPSLADYENTMEEWTWMPPDTKEAIQSDSTSPQAMAYNWTLMDPNLQTYPDWRIQQRFALVTLFYATQGSSWRYNHGWLDYEIHECYWHSFTSFFTTALATELPHIQLLMDRYQEITGDLYQLQNPCHEHPNSTTATASVAMEGRYRVLAQGLNGLRGSLPREIYLLESLTGIAFIQEPHLEGTLSTDLQQLSNLTFLALPSTPQLGGTIPTELGLLTNLIMISFSNLMEDATMEGTNQKMQKVTGTLPSEIGKLSHLMHLSLERNMISGSIPTEIGRLSNLLEFVVWRNGACPPSLLERMVHSSISY